MTLSYSARARELQHVSVIQMQEESKIAKPRVAVIGATGTIGAAVVKELANDYDVILAGRSCEGKGKVDITSAVRAR